MCRNMFPENIEDQPVREIDWIFMNTCIENLYKTCINNSHMEIAVDKTSDRLARIHCIVSLCHHCIANMPAHYGDKIVRIPLF